jgi:hypothetical protein
MLQEKPPVRASSSTKHETSSSFSLWSAWIRSDAKGRELLETIIEEGLQQLVSFPTHIKGNMLDLVTTNCAERVLEVCDVGRLGKSDHCKLSIVVEGEPQTLSQNKERYVWGKATCSDQRRHGWD